MPERREASLKWTFVANRAVERVLPPSLLWFVFWPLSAVRALRHRDAESRHLIRLLWVSPSKERKRISGLTQWRFRFEFDHRRIPLSFADRMRLPRWRSRFAVDGFDGLAELARRRPVVVITLHTLSCHILPMWLRSLGIQTGAVSAGQGWLREDVVRRSRVGQPGSARVEFTGGEPRELLRHLGVGGSLVLFSDYPVGHTITAPWRATTLRLSTGGFRLAARTGAAVVPVVITSAGRWKYRVHVGTPVPDAVVNARDLAAAAQHVADALLPVVATVPRQADMALIEAIQPLGAEAIAG